MNLLMVAIFVLGYAAIIFEQKIGVNKAASALLMAVSCWSIITIQKCYECGVVLYMGIVLRSLNDHLHEIAQLVIFLLGAMTIVALIESHDGFKIVIDFIRTRRKRTLLWAVSLVTFFLSAVLDNLTTSIAMVSLVRRLVEERDDRLIFAGMVIVAANAGGIWTPIGDVTTTMLWIGGRLTTAKMMGLLFIPSLLSVAVPLCYFSLFMKKETVASFTPSENKGSVHGARRIFFLGIGALVFVPVFKAITGLPPFMGILLGLGVLWALTDLFNRQREHLKVPYVLSKVDFSSIIFLLGVLLTVAAMETAGILDRWAVWMDTYLKNKDIIVALMGLMAAVIGNVPLTAASMGMYDLSLYPVDSKLWEMIAYSVGAGGSLLVIGSAAGVVVMGMEKITFAWYLRKITLPVFIGYAAGILSFLMIYHAVIPR